MRSRLIIILILLFTMPLFSQGRQDVKNVTFIHDISEKKAVTFGDAVKFFVLTIEKKPGISFEKNLDILKGVGIQRGLSYKGDFLIRKGILALLIADYLKLGDSLFYMIFKSQRYAFRACIANGIMDYDASEWDRVSGGELIEIMSKVSERASGGKE